eukprot:8609811-Prorocentrum_lima.AAC.1
MPIVSFFVVGLEEGGVGLAAMPLATKTSSPSPGGSRSLVPQRTLPDLSVGLPSRSATLSK